MRCQKLLVNWPFVTRHKVWKKNKTRTHRASLYRRERDRESSTAWNLYTQPQVGLADSTPQPFFFFHFISSSSSRRKENLSVGEAIARLLEAAPTRRVLMFSKRKKSARPFLFFFLLKDNLYQFIRVDIFRYIQTRFLSIDVEFEKNGDIFRVIVSLACSTNPSAFLENQFPSRMSPEFRITSNRGKDKGDATILSVRLYYGYLDASLRQRISLPVWIRLTEDAKHFLPWPETYRASAVSHFISEINKNKTQTGFYYCQSR